ncbi:ABC transporter permease, partial [Thermanaerothrix sp.]
MSAVTVTTPIRKNSGWRLFLQTVIGRAYPRVIGQQREKSWLIFEVLLPLINVAAYVYVYRAIGAPEDYVGFVVIGGAMIAFWMNVLWSMSSQLYWEKEQGNLALYIIAPTSLMAILLGMAIGGMIATLLRAGAIIALGTLLFNVHYVIINPWQLLAVFALTMIALYGLGMMTASVFLLFSREAWHYVNLAMEPVYLLSGFYFPLKNLGFWVALGASVIP